MKKILLNSMLLLSIFIFVGCEPTDWDVKKTSNWILCGEGKIIKKGYQQHPKYKSKRVIVLEFNNGNKYEIGHLKNASEVKIGQNGYLWKYIECGTPLDRNAWFQWIIDPTVIIEKGETNIEILESIRDYEIEIKHDKKEVVTIPSTKEEQFLKKYEWKPAFRIKPKVYITVLIRTEDNIVTTAYVDNKNEWKLETNKNAYSGGSPVSNVKEWKEIDID